VVFIFLNLMGPPEDIITVAGGWLMMAWFGAALGMLLGAWSERSETVEKLWHPTAYLVFPLSGAAYLVEALPAEFQKVVLWLPMVHGTELRRAGYFGSKFNPMYDLDYLFTCNMLLTLFAFAQERLVSRDFVPE
jgi:ABC-type polysaccharide/polyol phosphate export permease